MKKGFLLIIFFSLLFLPGAFASYGMICNSSAPILLVVQSYSFVDRNFSVKLFNNTNTDITVVSTQPQGALVLESASSGLIKKNELISISGKYPHREINENILLSYLNQAGEKKELTLNCRGSDPDVVDSGNMANFVFLALTIFFFVSSLILIWYGQKKGKPTIRAIGIILFLFFLLALFLLLVPVQP